MHEVFNIKQNTEKKTYSLVINVNLKLKQMLVSSRIIHLNTRAKDIIVINGSPPILTNLS